MEDLPMSESFIVRSSIRDYEVHFCESISNELNNIFKNGDYLFIDEKLAEVEGIANWLKNYQNVVKINAEESTKSYEGIIPFIEILISGGFKRNNRLIAIGGGITQDVTAFIASILYRGVDWIFFPTTLLAQADSCIGSKTSINFKKYKNQLGNFYPPLKIFINTDVLSTLQEKDIRSGVGEMAHYFFVSGSDDVLFFKNEFKATIENQSNIQSVIRACLAIKKRYIEIDEFDRKERIVFNYGHTFGHAIESITGYNIPHGVAVSFGMDMANYISWKKGYITENEFEFGHEIFNEIWKGYSIKEIKLDALLTAMGKDKKNENGSIGLILTKGWGAMFRDLTPPDEVFMNWMSEYMNLFQ
jgi:3-dehydroquinate synthase